MASKFVRNLRVVLVVAIGVTASNHGGIQGAEASKVLARATPVFFSNPNSYDSDRSRDYNRGD